MDMTDQIRREKRKEAQYNYEEGKKLMKEEILDYEQDDIIASKIRIMQEKVQEFKEINNGNIPKDASDIHAMLAKPDDDEEEKKEDDDGGGAKKGKGKKEAKKEKKEAKGKKAKGGKGDGESKQKVEETGPTEVV